MLGCCNSYPSPRQAAQSFPGHRCLPDTASHKAALHTLTGSGLLLKSEGWNWRCRKLLGKALLCSNKPLHGFNIFSEYISRTLQDFLGSCICSAFLSDWKLSSTIQFNVSPIKPWLAITLSFLWSQKRCYLDSLRGAAGITVLTTHLVHINLSPPCAEP